MTEMVERVARAMFDEFMTREFGEIGTDRVLDHWDLSNGPNPTPAQVVEMEGNWRESNWREQKDHYLAQARAAIEAMGDPTGAMVSAGLQAYHQWKDGDDWDEAGMVRRLHTVMFSAALGEL